MPTIFMLPASTAPREDRLSPGDLSALQSHFEVTNYEVVVDGQGIDWSKIDEIEVVAAARQRSPAGWIVRNLIFGGSDRYHVGIYSGRNELVLTNLTLEAARYVVQMIAYYARERIKYNGPDGLTATIEA
jgi:hypothetical protein